MMFVYLVAYLRVAVRFVWSPFLFGTWYKSKERSFHTKSTSPNELLNSNQSGLFLLGPPQSVEASFSRRVGDDAM